MKSAPILPLLIAYLALTACGGSNAVGALKIEPAPANITAPCKRPEDYLNAKDWEIIAGRIGDELIDCGAKQAALVVRDRVIVDALQGRDYWDIAP
jgi:hypothetical protein